MDGSFRLFRSLATALVVCGLVIGCGGGGGGGSRAAIVPDTTAPTITATTPTDAELGVVLDTVVSATLNEAASAASVDQASLTLTGAGAAVPGTVALTGNTITLTLQQLLEESEDYTATLSGTVADVAGNALGADMTWTFTTGDFTAPTVATTFPADTEVGVVLDTVVSATLNEAASAASVDQASLTLTGAGAAVPGTVTLAGNTITLTLQQLLEETEIYTATLRGTIEDVAGNALGADVTWNFTTGDFTPPTVTATSPVDGATDTRVDELAVATISEALDPASVSNASMTLTTGATNLTGNVTLGPGDASVFFTPDNLLNTVTDYEATLVDTVADLAGNPLDMTTTWSFRTGLIGTMSAIYASLESPALVRRVDAMGDQIVGSGPLSDPAWTGLEEKSLDVSPDATNVTYRVDVDVTDLMVGDELYVISVEGGSPIKLSGALTVGGSVWVADWSPDSSQVAYVADKDTDGVNELYVVNADGTGETKLTAGIGLDATFVAWSPSGAFIAVASSATEVPDQALYVVPAAGGAPVGISGFTTVVLDDGAQPQWSPDGARLAYATLQELFVNDTTGNVEFELSPATTTSVDEFSWFSDSTRVGWRGIVGMGVVDPNVFVGTIGVGSGSGLSSTDAFRYAIAPDDSLIAFTRTEGATQALYVAAPDGSGETRVSLSPVTAQSVREFDTPVWAPDSSAILYAERDTSLTRYELHLTTPDAVSNATLSDIEATSGELKDYTFSPDGTQVIYGAFSAGVPGGLINRVAKDGTGRTLLTDNAGGEDAASFVVRDDSGATGLSGIAF